MRTKTFVMSMGLAASVWLTGCQNSGVFRSDGGSSLRADLGRTHGEKATRTASRPVKNRPAPIDNPTLATRLTSNKKSTSGEASASCSTCVAANPLAKNSLSIPHEPSPPVSVAAAIPTSLPAPSFPTAVTPAQASTTSSLPERVVVASSSIPAPPPIAGIPSAPGMTSIPLPPNAGSQIVEVPVVAGFPSSPPTIPTTPSSFGPGVEVVGSQPAVESTTVPGETVVKDNVVTVRFGQANNYQIVVGQVYQFRRTWRLRFTAVESDDKYGGSFILVGDDLDNLRDGQMVRVEGSVLSEDRVGGSRYQVNRIQILEPDVK